MKKSWLTVVAGSWFLFTLIILFYAPVWDGPINVLTCLVGLIGTGFACIYLRWRWPWASLALVGSGVALLSIYVLKWGLFVNDYMLADAAPSLISTLWLLIWNRVFVAYKLVTGGQLIRAVIESYWELGMPLLQSIIVIFLVSHRISKGSPDT